MAAKYRFGTLVTVAVVIFALAPAEQAELERITIDVPQVWVWPTVRETSPQGDPLGFFLLRYHKAPAEYVSLGPIGLSLSIQEAPDIILYIAWGIKERDGGYDFSSATYAHRVTDEKWFVAPTGFIIKVGVGDMDVAHVVVYRIFVKEHPKFKGRVKVVSEYRVNYSSKTIQEIVFTMRDPEGIDTPYVGKFFIHPPREVQKKEKQK